MSGVAGEVERPEDRDGFMGLRQGVADGTINGEDYQITQNLGSGTVSVEFSNEDGETIAVHYSLGDIVTDAYERVFGKAPITPAEGVVGKCEDCGADIAYGEWHVLVESESHLVPDDTASKVVVGDPDAERLCADCSDREPDEFPRDENSTETTETNE
jgi:hypothetical protein